MKTKEKIDYAFSRIKELFLLINSWTRGVSNEDSLMLINDFEDIKKESKK